MNSRERMDIIEDQIADGMLFDEFEEFQQKLHELINNTAQNMENKSGYEHKWLYIAIQEIIGIVDRYDECDIDNEINQ